jgi:hypothetical protein
MALRLPLLALGAIAMLAGLCGGIWRIGWTPPHGAALAALHGPLLVSGLFGTLIGLERAVALGRGWPYAAPVLSGIGTLALLAGAPVYVGAGAYAGASVALAAASLSVTVQQPALFTGTLLFGAVAWLAGNVLWLMGNSVPDVVGWWLAFLVLTIAAERLELSRLLTAKRGSGAIFLFAVGLMIAGAQNRLATDNGAILFGLALLIFVSWLFRHDIALRNVRQAGQTRFMAISMLSGYVWAGLAGAMLIAPGVETSVFAYDAVLHAILIGFVFSMVFGHALIILPAIARLRIAYRQLLYGPLVVLHASVALRVVGDVAEWQMIRQWSGILTLLALLGFGLCIGSTAARRRSGQLEQSSFSRSPDSPAVKPFA